MSDKIENDLRHLYVWGLDAVDELRKNFDDEFSLGLARGQQEVLDAIGVILQGSGS